MRIFKTPCGAISIATVRIFAAAIETARHF
jgi:hypothetical protein